MPNPSSEPKQPTEATSAHAGWLTRAQVAAELGYRSIFPIRKMEGTKLHPVREARGWLFDPAEVSELKTARMAAIVDLRAKSVADRAERQPPALSIR